MRRPTQRTRAVTGSVGVRRGRWAALCAVTSPSIRPRPRFAVVLFDLDGTLADTIPLIVASYQHAFRTVLAEEVAEARARAVDRPPAAAGAARGEPRARRRARPGLPRVEPRQHRPADPALRRACPSCSPSSTAAGVTCAVATSKRRETARLALEGVGIDHLVDVVAAPGGHHRAQAGARPAAARRRVAGRRPGRLRLRRRRHRRRARREGRRDGGRRRHLGRGGARGPRRRRPGRRSSTRSPTSRRTCWAGAERLESPPCTGRGTRRTSTPSSRRSRMP